MTATSTAPAAAGSTTAYEAVCGLECHVQLATASKMFCGCSPDYAGAAPNTHVCPVCLGMPGVLPVINRKAVEFTIMTGLAIGAEIPEATKFDRKNYPYPDLVKGYQISQYDLPLVVGGAIEVAVDGVSRPIRFERIHLEEDTGKLTHGGTGGSTIDFNRAGVPLMEMVTRPDIRTPAEARAFLHGLRALLRTLGVSAADMEKGQLRCDVNVSLRPAGQEAFGTKVEVKNLNSFRSVYRALEFEIARQTAMLQNGETIHQETRGWQDERGVTVSQRSKEQAHDYRYFPEPDLPPLFVDRAWVDRLRAALPELPAARRERYVQQYGLSAYDAEGLSGDTASAAFFEASISAGADPKKAANWLQNDVARLRTTAATGGSAATDDVPAGGTGLLEPRHLVEILRLVESHAVSGAGAKQVLEAVYRTGKEPRAVLDDLGLAQLSAVAELEAIVATVIAQNPAPVADFRGGKGTAINFLKGQVMKASRGKANPAVAEELLRARLGTARE